MDVEKARYNMVEQQIRPWDVLNERTLAAMQEIPREQFVPVPYQQLAFSDTALPIGRGQTMLPPREEAKILQALRLSRHDHVLEIGTGSGFFSALLAHLSKHVTSVEIIPELAEIAKQRLAQLNCDRVEVHTGNGLAWPHDQLFDVIVFTGSLPLIPEGFKRMLRPHGRLFCVIGEAPAMKAMLLKRAPDHWTSECLFETVVPRLTGIPQEPTFSF